MKWVVKWLFRLFLLAVVLVVILLLSLNPILRTVMEHRIRAQTGMDAEIGKVSIGLVAPTVEIQNLRIFNPTNFGGTPFLSIPEIHVEYDRAALSRHEIHITLLRFNLGELDIVKNEAGQTNLFVLGANLPTKALKGGSGAAHFKQQTGYDFKGIDVLKVSIGKARFIDLQNQRNNLEQDIGLDNLVINNVKSKADVAGLFALVALRGGDFFKSVFGSPNQDLGILQLLLP